MKRDSSTPFHPAKDELRRTMRNRLREMDSALHAEASLVICQEATHQPAFTASKYVALFAPLPSEPDVRPLIEEAWAEGKRVLLPLMIKQSGRPQLDWHEVTAWDELVQLPGSFGLSEPDPLRCPRVPMVEIGCLFVPGLAFDEEGYRLGRGGGFYDSFLDLAPTGLPRFGMMFSCQRVPLVPREGHDQHLPVVITEDGLMTFAR